MEDVLRFLTSIDTAKIASDPRLMAATGAILILAIIFRWKAVLLLFFAIGGMMAVMRYSRIGESHGGFDRSLVIFIVGTIAVGVVLIYYLFIRSD